MDENKKRIASADQLRQYANQPTQAHDRPISEINDPTEWADTLTDHVHNGGRTGWFTYRRVKAETDANALIQVSELHDPTIDQGLAANPYWAEDRLDDLVDRYYRDDEHRRLIIENMCRRPNMSQQLGDKCADYMEQATPKGPYSTDAQLGYATALAKNPATPSSALARVESLRSEPDLLRECMNHPNATDATIAHAIERSHDQMLIGDALHAPNHGWLTVETAIRQGDPYTVRDAFSDPRIDGNTLRDWESHCSYGNLWAAEGAAANPKLDRGTAFRLLAYTPGGNDVKRRLAANPNAPEDLLDGLSASDDPEIRRNLANNPTVSEHVRNRLAAELN
ncbi:hypothetical protein [Bifidobacterium sp. SO1]|uniref:hypothetical protein n=1 Tax=Bifidobacterium sp. SO1 TaxID=2809029 RepID=UPI001BDCC78E|nr:hypothetical protein [Bifidobacterium sp. SO1]MBT1162864.1 hypothetical protein [Bifidobacterium sp. SO1]